MTLIANRFPTGDGSPLTWAPGRGAEHWALVDDYPVKLGKVLDGEGDFLYWSQIGGEPNPTAEDVFTFGPIAGIEEISKIELVLTYSVMMSQSSNWYGNIFMDGEWKTQQELPKTAVPPYYHPYPDYTMIPFVTSTAFTGSWDANDWANFKASIKAVGYSGDNSIRVLQFYARVTYTAAGAADRIKAISGVPIR